MYMLHLYGIKNIKIIVPASDDYNAIGCFWVTTAEVDPLVAHTLHAVPVASVEVITVGEVGHELSLHFPWLHLAAYHLYFVSLRH